MNKTDLRSQIADSFNKSELRSLCFDLGINYENLPGETLENKCRELITYCKRHGKFKNLINKCSELRPHINWSLSDDLEVEEAFPKSSLGEKKFQSFTKESRNYFKFKGNGILWFSALLIIGGFLIIRALFSGNLTFGDPVQIEENKYLVKLAGNETVNLFSDDIEITFVDKPDGTVVISRGPLVPDIGQLNVQSLGYARQTFGLGLDEEAIYESTHKYSILVTDIYFPDSDWGKSDAYIELVVTKND